MLESNATGGLEEEKEVCKLLYRRRQTFIFQHSLNPHVLPSIGCVRTFLHRWLWKQSVDRFLKRWVAYFPNKMICFLIMLPPFSLNLSIFLSHSLVRVLLCCSASYHSCNMYCQNHPVFWRVYIEVNVSKDFNIQIDKKIKIKASFWWLQKQL